MSLRRLSSFLPFAQYAKLALEVLHIHVGAAHVALTLECVPAMQSAPVIEKQSRTGRKLDGDFKSRIVDQAVE